MENKHYSINEVFKLIGEENLNIESVGHTRENIEVDGFKVYKKSMRYATFYQKGTRCVCCGKEGTYFQLDPDIGGGNIENRRHFNLYADDGTLITKDHILPKKWGGEDTIDNFQTMCETCNKEKGSNCNFEIDGIIATSIKDENKNTYYVNIDKAIYDMCHFSGVFSKGGKPSKIAERTIKVATRLYSVIDTNNPAYGRYWKHGKFIVNEVIK